VVLKPRPLFSTLPSALDRLRVVDGSIYVEFEASLFESETCGRLYGIADYVAVHARPDPVLRPCGLLSLLLASLVHQNPQSAVLVGCSDIVLLFARCRFIRRTLYVCRVRQPVVRDDAWVSCVYIAVHMYSAGQKNRRFSVVC